MSPTRRLPPRKASIRRSVAEKMGIKAETRSFFANAPESALKAIELPSLEVSATLRGTFGYIHLFAVSQAVMDNAFPKLRAHLGVDGELWVSWPKSRQMGTDLT